MPLTGEKKREYQKEWTAKRRQAWIAEHGPCAICESTDRLEVDHIDPDTKTMDATNLWGMALTNPIRVKELENCQVLCYTCHKAKTKRQFEVTEHGTTMYRKGCRCDVCRTASTVDRRKYARNKS